jgi:hypothetical protein
MSPVGEVWRFTRERLQQAIQGLNDVQVAWRPFPGGHCIAEYGYHVAACELYWAIALRGETTPPDAHHERLLRAVHDGFLRDAPSPWHPEDLTVQKMNAALRLSYDQIFAHFESPDPEALSRPLVSPIGDRITGHEGLVRLAQHAGYHTGQINLIQQHPDFPSRG